MSVLEHKIDFAVLVTAANANPNGDPLNGNRPRENWLFTKCWGSKIHL